MPRLMLSDSSWDLISKIMYNTGRVYKKKTHRNLFEGILYRMRTGFQWRDLPSDFGPWNTVFTRFNTWASKGVIADVFQALAKRHDCEWLFLDGSIVKAHQDSSSTADATAQSIGQSRGGKTTKIHLAVDSGGLPVHFELSGGQKHDVSYGEALVSASPTADFVIADKGYDSEVFRCFIAMTGAQHVIPRRGNNKTGNADIDWSLYRYRHLVENAFLRIKKYRGVCTRYDKLGRNYHAMVSLAFSFMWLPMWID